jgi:hypothetical protein
LYHFEGRTNKEKKILVLTDKGMEETAQRGKRGKQIS